MRYTIFFFIFLMYDKVNLLIFILFSNVLELLVDKKMGKNSLRGATDSVVVEDSDMC